MDFLSVIDKHSCFLGLALAGNTAKYNMQYVPSTKQYHSKSREILWFVCLQKDVKPSEGVSLHQTHRELT